MAIAFVAAGAPVGGNTGVSSHTVNVPTPAGLAANQLLVMAVAADDNTGPATPTGWNKLTSIVAGTATASPFNAPPHGYVYWKIATGSEGASVPVVFAAPAWPVGTPYYAAAMLAYSGTDLSNPITEWASNFTTSNAKALSHPVITTTVINDWLLTFRWGASDFFGATSYTNSVGTDAERIDTNDNQVEQSLAMYDSNGPLATGLQTQRITTASLTPDFGSAGISIAIRVPTNSITQANPTDANGIGTAFNASVVAADGSWQLCDTMPRYSFAIDWDGNGSLFTPGANLSLNPYFTTDTSNWSPSGAAIQRVPAAQSPVSLTALLVTPDGVSASGGVNQSPHLPVGSVTAGNTYTSDAWVYSPGGWSDLRSAVDWYDSGNVFLSSSLGSGSAVPAGAWTHLVQTFTAPASASRASVRVRHAGTPPSSAVYYVYGLLLIDPAAAGTFSAPGPGEDSTPDVLDGGVSISYGRDQSRLLNPAKTGTESFSLNNTRRMYSPEYSGSPLFGDLDPARIMRGDVSFNGSSYALGRMRIDDYNITADLGNRTVDFTFLDGMKTLDGIGMSTSLRRSQRTGDLVNYILDQVGWTGPRDIDPGATIVPWWWLEGTTALQAMQDLVKSEGPPAIVYVALDGTFVFRDRHHRILRPASLTPQAYYAQSTLGDCASPAATGLSFAAPFTYAHGWRNIVNSVTFDAVVRAPSGDFTTVWTYGNPVSLTIGQSVEIPASASDPFRSAIVPVLGTDYTVTGAGTVQVALSRTSGAAVVITLAAVGGSVTITGLQLRAQSVPVVSTTTVVRKDTDSILSHGEQVHSDTAPWAGPGDSYAIAGLILLHYAKRRPTVELRLTASDPRHLFEILNRAISDRIHITYGEMGMDKDFFVETVTHAISRMNQANQPPVHSVVFGCEEEVVTVSNPFRFDTRGSGFDQGAFDPLAGDNPDQVFVWDDPQGSFDFGLFGT
jgi:hypothetical protein